MIQLREYEPIYQAQKMLQKHEQDLERLCNKRSIHQVDLETPLENKTEDTMDS